MSILSTVLKTLKGETSRKKSIDIDKANYNLSLRSEYPAEVWDEVEQSFLKDGTTIYQANKLDHILAVYYASYVNEKIQQRKEQITG